MNRNLIIALAVIIVLLTAGELYIITTLHANPSQQGGAMNGGAPEAAGNSAAIPSNTLTPLGGVIKSVAGSTITLASGASSTVAVTVGSDAHIASLGAQKSAVKQESDMEAFHTYSQSLAADPVKNKAALMHLVAPSQYEETPIAVSSLKAGDFLSVYGEREADGTYTAYYIYKMPQK